MSETPQARLRHSRGFALVWLVPLAALGLVIWLGVRTLVQRGPLVTIAFDTADGLEPGRTKVRHKAVDVGIVESVGLAPDLHHVIVTARIDRSIEDAVTSGASFWVVRPRLSPAGISGLGTIVSGTYLELDPGHRGTPQLEFKGLEEPPLADPDVPGKRFRLHADRLGGLSQGAPIYHRGVVVGEVLGGQLNKIGDGVDVPIFIHAPYTSLVHPATRFWNTSGVSISAGANGVKASLESLQALVAGGIEFDTLPVGGTEEAPEKAGTDYPLFDDAAAAQAHPWGSVVPYQVHFTGPVELQGSPIGHVTDVHLDYDPRTGTLSTPVAFEIEPERIKGFVPEAGRDGVETSTNALLAGLIAKGLRAHLGTANLLTGQRMIALDFDPDAKLAVLRTDGAQPEFPAGASSDIDSLTRSAGRVMDAVAAIPFKDIGDHISALTQNLDNLTGSADTKAAVKSLNQTLTSLNRIIDSADQQMPALLTSLNNAAEAAHRTLDVLGGQGGRGTDLRGLLHELEEAARSIRALADLLQAHPEALVKGRTNEAK
jgi:paraquat-inducible protein B